MAIVCSFLNQWSHHQRRHIFSGQDQSMMRLSMVNGSIYAMERQILEYINQSQELCTLALSIWI